MDPNAQFEKNVRGFYTWLGAMLCAALAPLVAQRLIDMATFASRVGAVALGTAAWVPIGLVTARIIRQGDEFVRRIHLVAIAIAFAGGLLMISVLDWLVRAGFLERPPLMVLWLAIALLWAAAVLGTNAYYARGR